MDVDFSAAIERPRSSISWRISDGRASGPLEEEDASSIEVLISASDMKRFCRGTAEVRTSFACLALVAIPT